MVEELKRYVCDKCKRAYDAHGEAQYCESKHTVPDDMDVVKVDYNHGIDHVTGFPQAITTTLKGKDRDRRAVYVLRFVEHDYIPDRPCRPFDCNKWHPDSRFSDRGLDEKMCGMLD